MDSPIHTKSRDFAIRIIGCYNYLVGEKHEMVMSKQLLRCGTSIGANTRESKNAQSRMDFLSKLNIALKEADETDYWLDLLHETKYINDKQFESLNSDCKELSQSGDKMTGAWLLANDLKQMSDCAGGRKMQFDSAS